MRPALDVLLAAILVIGGAATAVAQEATATAPAPAGDRSTWMYPVGDRASYSSRLFDLLEYQRVDDRDRVRWNFVGWYGGDRRRLWIKSEGALENHAGARGNAEMQALYGKLISPFFDLQAGVRVEQRRALDGRPVRTFAVLALQGLAPYHFDVEPALFVSHTGKVSGRLAASYTVLLTQRLALQGRGETTISAQRDVAFGVERGIDEAELGLRLRHEISREFAPYVGLSYRHRFAPLPLGGNIRPGELEMAVGVRAWF